jgi:hypothetical protein
MKNYFILLAIIISANMNAQETAAEKSCKAKLKISKAKKKKAETAKDKAIAKKKQYSEKKSGN